MTKETAKEGRVSVKHYQYYINSMKAILFVSVVALFMVAEAFKVCSNLILAEWTKNFNPETNWNYIGYYSLMAFACTSSGGLSNLWLQYRAAAASTCVHASILTKLMHA